MWKPVRMTRWLAGAATVGCLMTIPVGVTFACDDDYPVRAEYDPRMQPMPAPAPVVVVQPPGDGYGYGYGGRYEHWRRERAWRHYFHERAAEAHWRHRHY
jgi:hypothetical protein